MAEGNIPLVARIMVQHGGGSGAPVGMNDARRQSRNMDAIQKSTSDTSKNSDMSLKKMIGIFAGVGLIFGFVYKMFKNSQVTKSVFGSMFKILGAMVDVFLAPFVPYIVPLLEKMASWLDPIAKFGEQVAQKWMPKLVNFFQTFAEIWQKEGWRSALKYAWETVATPIFNHIIEAVKAGILAVLPWWMKAKVPESYASKIERGKEMLGRGIWQGLQDPTNIGTGGRNSIEINFNSPSAIEVFETTSQTNDTNTIKFDVRPKSNLDAGSFLYFYGRTQ